MLTDSDGTTGGTVESRHVPGKLGLVDGQVRRERAVFALLNNGCDSDLALIALGSRQDSTQAEGLKVSKVAVGHHHHRSSLLRRDRLG